MSDNEVIERALARKTKPKPTSFKGALSSGSTLLNLACTGRVKACFLPGHFYWFVGDSTSGKTFVALTCLAEAAINEKFEEYRLIYDNSEDGALMNIEKFFGPKVAERLEPPHGTKEEPIYSELVDDVYFYIDDALREDKPFIYILDSMDALEAKEDKEHFTKLKNKRLKGSKREIAGSYGMSKSKTNSAMLRAVVAGLRKSKSILIIISQTRDNVGFGARFDPKTTAGGRALKFYSTLEIWTAVKEKIKKTVRKKNRTIGIISKIRVKKNRITGRDRTVEVPIFYSVGLDDLLSCINYLVEEGHWTGKEDSVKAPEFDYNGSKEGLVRKIEEEDLEQELRSLVGEVYGEIEKACQVNRKPRYT